MLKCTVVFIAAFLVSLSSKEASNNEELYQLFQNDQRERKQK